MRCGVVVRSWEAPATHQRLLPSTVAHVMPLCDVAQVALIASCWFVMGIDLQVHVHEKIGHITQTSAF